MLHQFLEKNQKEILALTEEKTRVLAGSLHSTPQLKAGLPLFYTQLIKILEQKLNNRPTEDLITDAATHGGEFLRLGYSLSHVVHAYGAMCQAITELATMKNAQISAEEFNILNGCLDVAIAAAVSEFQFRSTIENEARETKHLGFLAHELRNALSSATVASEMIKAGLVGTGGSTANVLAANLTRMRHLIDRSLLEVRMRAEIDLLIEKFCLSSLIDDIILTAQMDADKKRQFIHVSVDPKMEIEADRQMILSAVVNLIQNAIKYSRPNSTIQLRAKQIDDRVQIEVEDECGGLEMDKIKSLFEPYTQSHSDRSGLGLGLSITQKAVNLSHGTITVNNLPKRGCIFMINIPQKLSPPSGTKVTVSGKDSIQPKFFKKG